MNPMSALGQAFGAIGNGIGHATQDVSSYLWKGQPTDQATQAMPQTPMSLGIKSPVPMTPLTNQLNPKIQSPIPQQQVVPHPIAPSGLENTIQGIQNFGGNVAKFFGGNQPPKPSYPGQDQWAQYMQKRFGGNPQEYQQTYAKAVTSPGFSGQYYGQQGAQPAPVAQQSAPQQLPGGNVPPDAFSGFTTAPVPSALQGAIYNAAIQNGVSPDVLASILYSEHGFQTTPGINQNVDQNGIPIPGNYDRGIAQINTFAHPDVTDQQAEDPNFAIPYSAHLLSNYIRSVGGDVNKGIAAYNVGVGGATVNGQSGALGPQGQHYLDAVARDLTPQTIQRLGIHPSFPVGK